MKENMSIETTAAGGVLIKIFGVPLLVASAGTALGFLLMWPKTIREAFVRFTCAIIFSFTVGPMLALAAWASWPELFETAKRAVSEQGADPLIGVLIVGAPFLLFAALGSWWITGGFVLWFQRRKGKDIGELVKDAAATVREVRGGL
jgi:hypothetical protein